MNRKVRASAVAGVCALLMLAPITVFDYLSPLGDLTKHPFVYSFSGLIFLLFIFSYTVFVLGFVQIGKKNENGMLVWSSYLLAIVYLMMTSIGIALYFHLEFQLASIANYLLTAVRGTLYSLIGMLVLETSRNYDGLEKWSRLSEQIFRVDKWSLCRG